LVIYALEGDAIMLSRNVCHVVQWHGSNIPKERRPQF